MTATDVDPLALDRQLCFALAATSRSVIGLYRDLLDPLGLTHPQYLVMLALWEHDPRSVREIAAELRLDSATLSPCSSASRHPATSDASAARPTNASSRCRSPPPVGHSASGRAPSRSRWPTGSAGRSTGSSG